MVTPETSSYSAIEDLSSRSERIGYWQVAEGLQAVDGLATSPYLESVAQGHIDGDYDSSYAVSLVRRYYEEKESHLKGDGQEEADTVASRIVELLTKASFSFRPSMLKIIHGELFRDLIAPPYDFGFRDYNITKPESVLAGESVGYASYMMLDEDLFYDFNSFDYRGFMIDSSDPSGSLRQFERFISNIWQAHPFIEGNTRTTAVFTQLLLRSKGASVDNGQFAKHSLYFRNALVRANYASIDDGIEEDHSHLLRFFENLLLGTNHKLRNRDLYCEDMFRKKGLPSPSELFAEHEKAKKQNLDKSPSAALANAERASKLSMEEAASPSKDRGRTV